MCLSALERMCLTKLLRHIDVWLEKIVFSIYAERMHMDAHVIMCVRWVYVLRGVHAQARVLRVPALTCLHVLG
jgi:hypothetical protein